MCVPVMTGTSLHQNRLLERVVGNVICLQCLSETPITTTKARKGEHETGEQKLQRSPFPFCALALAQLAPAHLPARCLEAHLSQYELTRFTITHLFVLRRGKDS